MDAQLQLSRKQLAEAIARRDQAAGTLRSVVASLASIKGEHAELKTQAVSALTVLTERELDALAQQQAAATAEAKAEAALKHAETSSQELTAKSASIAETIKLLTKQFQAETVKLNAAAETGIASSTQATSLKQQVDAKSAELATLQKELKETQDEVQRKSVSDKVAATKVELDQLKQSLVVAEKQLADATNNKLNMEQRLKECQQKIAAAKEATTKLQREQDRVKQSLSALTADRDRLSGQTQKRSQLVAKLRDEIEMSHRNKEEVAKKMAVLVARQSELTQQEEELTNKVATEEASRQSTQTRIDELEKLAADRGAALAAAKSEMETVSKHRAELADRLKAQPAVIRALATEAKTHAGMIPKLEKQVADAKAKTQDTKAAISGAKAAVDTATAKLDAAKRRLEGVQSELVAFQSHAENLQAELEAVQSVALEKRTAVEPEAVAAGRLEESMSARAQELEKIAGVMKSLQAELDALQQAQSTDQSKLDEAKSRLQELEAAAEEAEAAAEASKEKIEFFQSAYGA